MTREEVQAIALQKLVENNYNGVLVKKMGSGKSKTAIDAIIKGNFKYVLITSPRTNLKDSWYKEIRQWFYPDAPINSSHNFVFKNVTFNLVNIQTCYKWDIEFLKPYDLIIYDEIHTCGEQYFKLISNAKQLKIPVIGLTGTPNLEDGFKKETLYTTLPILYTYQDSDKDGLINKRRYYIYQYNLSDEYKVIAGTKKKPFTIGELSQYEYLSQNIKKGQMLMSRTGSTDWFSDAAHWGWGGNGTPDQKSAALVYLNAIKYRKEFLWNLSSSADIAVKFKHKILDSRIANKVLLFSELTTQANKLSAYAIHSKNADDVNKQLLESFDTGKIRELSSVRSLSLGLNLVGANWAILESYNSSPTDILQKLGRTNRLTVNDIANIIIIVPKGTQAEQWFNEFSKSLDLEDAVYINDVNDLKI